MRASANAILVFKESHFFLIRMVFHEERIDTAFSSGKTAAAGHGGVDLILCNEMLDGWHLGKVRRKSPAGQVKVFQVLPDFPWPMVMKAQQVTVLLIGSPEGSVFFLEGLAESRVTQLLGKPCSFFWEPGSLNTGQTGQIPGISGFIAEIVVQMPKFFCKEGAFIACRFCKLHIGGKLATFQKFPDALCGALPGNDLGRPVITDRLPVGKMDTILGIPCAHTAKAVAAVVQRFQYLGNLSGGFLLFKGCNHTLPLAVCIAAQTQHMVNIILGKRKSRGCMRYILCFIYGLDLFRFGEEQV